MFFSEKMEPGRFWICGDTRYKGGQWWSTSQKSRGLGEQGGPQPFPYLQHEKASGRLSPEHGKLEDPSLENINHPRDSADWARAALK